jgi:cell wall-associated NlpC family hydrolase
MTIRYDHLTGLEFDHGRRDCYELARDFYWDNYGIRLSPVARPDDWWDHGMNLYMDGFRDEGFEVIHPLPRDIRVGDGFLMAVYRDTMRRTALENREKVANHCAVYLGQGKILHHYYGRRSEVETYKGLWQNTTVAILRHKDVPLVQSTAGTIDYMDLLPPHLKAKLEKAKEILSGQQGEGGLCPVNG